MRADSVFVAKNGTDLLFEANFDPKGPDHLRRDGLDSESISPALTPDCHPPPPPVINFGRAFAVPAEVTEEACPEPAPDPVLEEQVPEVSGATKDDDMWALPLYKSKKSKRKKGISRHVFDEPEPPASGWP